MVVWMHQGSKQSVAGVCVDECGWMGFILLCTSISLCKLRVGSRYVTSLPLSPSLSNHLSQTQAGRSADRQTQGSQPPPSLPPSLPPSIAPGCSIFIFLFLSWSHTHTHSHTQSTGRCVHD
uniref:Uncharacterized protein n=1 Tax=Vitrella brassicaformis TaxID=1169539 RepID=A0A7S1P066_9ALVE